MRMSKVGGQQKETEKTKIKGAQENTNKLVLYLGERERVCVLIVHKCLMNNDLMKDVGFCFYLKVIVAAFATCFEAEYFLLHCRDL